MATKCCKVINRASLSSLKSFIKSTPKSFTTAPLPRSTPRFSFSRIPAELGGAQSLMPLHSTVAVARMTSCLSVTSRSYSALSQGTLCRTSPGL